MNDSIIRLLYGPKTNWQNENGKKYIQYFASESMPDAKSVNDYLEKCRFEEGSFKVIKFQGVIGRRLMRPFIRIVVMKDLFNKKIIPIRNFYFELNQFDTPEKLSKLLTYVPDNHHLTELGKRKLQETAFYRKSILEQIPGSNQFKRQRRLIRQDKGNGTP